MNEANKNIRKLTDEELDMVAGGGKAFDIDILLQWTGMQNLEQAAAWLKKNLDFDLYEGENHLFINGPSPKIEGIPIEDAYYRYIYRYLKKHPETVGVL